MIFDKFFERLYYDILLDEELLMKKKDLCIVNFYKGNLFINEENDIGVKLVINDNILMLF